ncbi:MAG: hypothetical protein JHC12_04820 [Thermogladius sp.]|jgi:hypothetical protein|nr:hypothetical protein [Thermogladius sp.]
MSEGDVLYKTLEEVSSLSIRAESLKEISRLIGIPYDRLAKIVRRGIRSGLLHEYYHAGIHKLGKIEFHVIGMSQKIPQRLCLAGLQPKIVYPSFTSRPVLLVYKEAGEFAESRYGYICKSLFRGLIRDVIIPVEKNGSVEFVRFDEIVGGDSPVDLDFIDEVTLLTIFKSYNPPSNPLGLAELYRLVGLGVSYGSFINHYYRHIHGKLVKRRLVLRREGSYAILIASSPNMSVLRDLFNELVKIRVVTGVDQLNVVDYSPVIAVAHVWVNPQHLYSMNVNHDVFNFTSYEIYLVRPQGG